MWLVLLGMRLLEVMFFIGIIGSAVVVTITSVEDAFELFGSEEQSHPPETTTSTP